MKKDIKLEDRHDPPTKDGSQKYIKFFNILRVLSYEQHFYN